MPWTLEFGPRHRVERNTKKQLASMTHHYLGKVFNNLFVLNEALHWFPVFAECIFLSLEPMMTNHTILRKRNTVIKKSALADLETRAYSIVPRNCEIKWQQYLSGGGGGDDDDDDD